jgi:hypothetical protein
MPHTLPMPITCFLCLIVCLLTLGHGGAISCGETGGESKVRCITVPPVEGANLTSSSTWTRNGPLLFAGKSCFTLDEESAQLRRCRLEWTEDLEEQLSDFVFLPGPSLVAGSGPVGGPYVARVEPRGEGYETTCLLMLLEDAGPDRVRVVRLFGRLGWEGAYTVTKYLPDNSCCAIKLQADDDGEPVYNLIMVDPESDAVTVLDEDVSTCFDTSLDGERIYYVKNDVAREYSLPKMQSRAIAPLAVADEDMVVLNIAVFLEDAETLLINDYILAEDGGLASLRLSALETRRLKGRFRFVGKIGQSLAVYLCYDDLKNPELMVVDADLNIVYERQCRRGYRFIAGARSPDDGKINLYFYELPK